MPDTCCSVPAAGAAVREQNLAPSESSVRSDNACPNCGQPGKAIQTQTVKALLTVSLRVVTGDTYLFCRTPACPIVYFAAGGAPAFTTDQVREPVYQKQSDVSTMLVCYCFQHHVADVRAASTGEQASILADIAAGIQANQCACDVRNPQGSCCLGNVRALLHASNARAETSIGCQTDGAMISRAPG